MPTWLGPALLAFGAGVAIVIQQAINADLRNGLNSAAWAGFASYVGGTLCMVLFAAAMRDPVPAPAVIARIPLWAWCGGALGAVYIALAIVLVPQLGSTTFVALLIAGQLLSALVFDHFGLLGLAQRPIDLTRAIGVGLLVAGILLIRK